MFPLLDQLFSDPLRFIQDALYRIPAILIALVLHEWAHAYVAYRLGDPTAKHLGRLTLNPMKHLDPVGAIMLFFLGFGYAKPVPINPNYFKNKHRDDLLVSIAGITMNILLYLFFILIYFFLTRSAYSLMINSSFWTAVLPHVVQVITSIALVNLSIAVFNLIPVPPLDGFHVLNDLILKGNLFVQQKIAQMGMGVLLVLSFTGLLGKVINAIVSAVLDGTFWLLYNVFGV